MAEAEAEASEKPDSWEGEGEEQSFKETGWTTLGLSR